jgi:2-iminobutanoate/2-iminopropanoate deaminase
MPKEIIQTQNAPAPIGPYSQAVKAGNIIFISGQVALVPGTDTVITDNIIDEAHQVMKNLKAILTEAGINFGNVVKTNIYLSDMSLFAAVNDVYGEYFTADMPGSHTAYPARETVAVKTLPKNVNVEISMIASI